jgi:F-type H+-transporting ATPase subunit alpha
VISITDGQIFLESDLFNSGVRPAINVGNSVSRVGGSAQTKAMKSVAGTLRIDLAQFRELAAFAQFGSDLDKSTQSQLERGKRLTEILKQGQYQPMEVEDQVIIIWTVTNGFGDDIAVEDLKRFEAGLLDFIRNAHPGIRTTLREKKVIDDSLKAKLKEAVEDFKGTRWNKEGVIATAA